MSSPDDGIAITVVIEMAPGWIYVKIAEPKPKPERIELLLGKTIEQWSNAHPQFVIDKTEALTEHGILQGINVWYYVGDHQLEPVAPEPPQQPFAIELHNQIRQQLPKEHIEAVVDEAMQIWRSHQDGYSTMVVITPRRIGVIFDKHANRAAMVPVDLIYPAIEDATRAKVLNWLEAPSTRLHVIQIPGSWFSPYKYETQIKVVDSSFTPTNMTYDPGSPPEK